MLKTSKPVYVLRTYDVESLIDNFKILRSHLEDLGLLEKDKLLQTYFKRVKENLSSFEDEDWVSSDKHWAEDY